MLLSAYQHCAPPFRLLPLDSHWTTTFLSRFGRRLSSYDRPELILLLRTTSRILPSRSHAEQPLCVARQRLRGVRVKGSLSSEAFWGRHPASCCSKQLPQPGNSRRARTSEDRPSQCSSMGCCSSQPAVEDKPGQAQASTTGCTFPRTRASAAADHDWTHWTHVSAGVLLVGTVRRNQRGFLADGQPSWSQTHDARLSTIVRLGDMPPNCTALEFGADSVPKLRGITAAAGLPTYSDQIPSDSS